MPLHTLFFKNDENFGAVAVVDGNSKLEQSKSRSEGREYGYNLYASTPDQERKAKWERLRRVPENGRHLGASANVPRMWARGLLRFFEEQTCHETFSLCETPDHAFDRTRRELEVVLRGRIDVRLTVE
jgi:hypothetical protein